MAWRFKAEMEETPHKIESLTRQREREEMAAKMPSISNFRAAVQRPIFFLYIDATIFSMLSIMAGRSSRPISSKY